MHHTRIVTRGQLASAVCAATSALLLATLALVALPAAGAAADPTAPAADERERIEPALVTAFEKSGGQPQDFWVSFGASARTSAAADIDDWAERGQYVYSRLRAAAKLAQAEAIKRLEAAGARYTSYWITNAIRVEDGSAALATALAAEPGVQRVFAPVAYEQPDPVKAELTGSKLGPNAEAEVEWGVANIKADRAWRRYGVRGDGIVVASIDSGAQFDHPALVNAYRGNNGDGTFTNDYNWYDVTGQSDHPADGNGHGTHTMGTMVGDDGAANRTGVAPGATWIAANGCCPSDQALLDSSQWMLAPTKVDGSAADPAKRPNIINNSWGSRVPGNDPFLEDIQQAWADAGIFGVWANGNLGPDCSTSGFPGSRLINYSVGAYDSGNTVAGFSSRGPGQDGEVKPNLSAPGVSVRSAAPGGRYSVMSGTSMAAPHVAGAVALLWSVDPSLVGDTTRTRQMLDDTATDTADDQCGGTADDNNVYGEGRLDALALVEAAEQSDLGTLTGTLTDAETGDPVGGTAVRLRAGDISRSVRTGDDGRFQVSVRAADYAVTVTAAGYEDATATVTVVADGTTTQDLALTRLPGHAITGRVVDKLSGDGIPEATVTVTGTLYGGTTGPDGTFRIEGVPGSRNYLVSVNAGLCGARLLTRSVSVGDADTNVPDIVMPRYAVGSRKPSPYGSGGGSPYGSGVGSPYGYTCVTEPSSWVPGDTPVELAPEDANGRRSTKVDLPFAFRFQGRPFTSIGIFAPGERAPGLGAGIAFCLRDPRWPESSLKDECGPESPAQLLVDQFPVAGDRGRVLTKVSGRAPNRTFIIEWRDYTYPFSDADFDLGLTLHENGDLVLAGHDIDADSELERFGRPVKTPVDNRDLMIKASFGDPTFIHCCTLDRLQPAGAAAATRWPWRSDATQLRLDLPDAGVVSGVVSDSRTGRAVANAVVEVRRPDGGLQWQFRTDVAGRYRAEIFARQPYTVTAYKPTAYQRAATREALVTRARPQVSVDLALTAASPSVKQSLADGEQVVTISNKAKQDYSWTAALDVRRPDGPAPGTLTRATDTGAGATRVLIGVEEVGDSWWIGVADLRTAKHEIREYTTDGIPTGTVLSMAPIAERLGIDPAWMMPTDLAFLESTQELCFVVEGHRPPAPDTGVKPFNDIICVTAEDGRYSRVIRTDIPDTHVALGLAYDEQDDRIFLQHSDWSDTVPALGTRISTLRGIRGSGAGTLSSTCSLYGVRGLGLAYQAGSRTLWKMWKGQGSQDTIISQVDPRTCVAVAEARGTTVSPQIGVMGADVRADGTVLGSSLSGDVVEYATGDTLVPETRWLRLSRTSGTVAKGGRVSVEVEVDEDRIPSDVDGADLVISGNGGSRKTIRVPIRLRESERSNTSLTISARPATVKVGKASTVTVKVRTGADVEPTGQVALAVTGRSLVRANLVNGVATFRVGPFGRPRRVALRASYAGDVWNRASVRVGALRVVAPALALTNPVMKLSRGSATAVVRCTSQVSCTGWAVVTKGRVRLAGGPISLRAGQTETLRLRLTTRGAALLRGRKEVRATLEARLAGGNTKRWTVKLKR